MATILLIDDDVTLLARLAEQLGAAGYQVSRLSEIAPAEVQVSEHPPDLVLLEVRTSRGAGWRFLERFASMLPIIVLSAEGREEDVIRGLEAGAVDYLAKPYRSAELLTRVRLRLAALVAEPTRPGPVPAAQLTVPDDLAVPPAPANRTPHPPQPTPPTNEPPPAPAGHATHPPDDDRSIFISENEELAMMRAESNGAAPPLPADTLPQATSLGAALWAERQRRRVTLVEAENRLWIRMWYLQAMEEEKFTLLPRGPMAEQMLRSYAAHLGIDVKWALEEYRRLHPDGAIPPPPVFSDAPRRLPSKLIWVGAALLALIVSLSAILLLDPQGVSNLTGQVQTIFSATAATPTPPTTSQPGAAPTAASSGQAAPLTTTTPTATPRPTTRPTATPPPEIVLPDLERLDPR